MHKVLLITITIFYSFICQAGSDTTYHYKKDKLRIQPVPVISYAPETRLLFGAGALAIFELSSDSTTHYSLISPFIAYTQNHQSYLYIPYFLYTKDNKYYIDGEADYYNYSYYYWGIGTNRVPKELYKVRFPRLQVNAYRKVIPHFYVGIDYFYENDDIWKTVPGGELSQGAIPGSRGSISSGFGIDASYDTRDSVYFPHSGWYIKGVSYFNSPILGASSNFGRVITDINYYHQLCDPVVLAVNEHTQLSWGNVPFNQLALVGGTKQMRGYYTGYYRDDAFTYLQAEARIHLIGRVSLAAFGSAGLLGNYTVFPEMNPIFAEGLGLRYNYATHTHVNVRLDIAYGTSVEFYLTIQEAF